MVIFHCYVSSPEGKLYTVIIHSSEFSGHLGMIHDDSLYQPIMENAPVAGFGRYKHISSCFWYRSPATYPAALQVELKRKAWLWKTKGTPSVHTKIATLWWFNVAMENHHFQWENQHKWISNSYVKLPEGSTYMDVHPSKNAHRNWSIPIWWNGFDGTSRSSPFRKFVGWSAFSLFNGQETTPNFSTGWKGWVKHP